MSATILRTIIGKRFEVAPSKIVLSGEINTDHSWVNSSHGGSMGSEANSYDIYGFKVNEDKMFDFIDLSEFVGHDYKSNYAHSESFYDEGILLHEIPNIDNFIFIVEVNQGHRKWSGQRQEEWDSITLFKCPDFKEKWAEVEANDLLRWKNWLKGGGASTCGFQDHPFVVDFNITGSDAYTLSESHIGTHEDTGWTIEGEIHEDYYTWVNEFKATHPDFGLVWGDFEKSVMAYSQEGYEHFLKNHPPESWDYYDI